jgi:rod shape-determining protein MreD
MGNYLSILILGLAAAVQSTFVPQIRLLGGEPDLVFLIVVSWSVNASLEDSVLWAFVGGIMQNLLSAAPLGTASMGLVLVVFTLDTIRRQVYRVGLPLLILIVILGSFVYQLVVMFILSLTEFEIRFLDSLRYVVAPTIAYNLVFIWPIYWFIRRVQRRLARSRPVLS